MRAWWNAVCDCRSGRIISPVKPGTQLNFPLGNPPPDAPAAALETPFKASSQEQVIEGRSGPGTDGEVIPNSGRGGHAGTSDSLETSRPGVMRLQTQAVGRKWNSSGVAAVGQVLLLAPQVLSWRFAMTIR